MSSDGEKGYPQNILVKGPALLVCTCYEGPQYPPVWADYITTFDPPMALRLLDVADAAVTMADPKWRTLSLADFQLRMERLVGAVGALMAPRPNW